MLDFEYTVMYYKKGTATYVTHTLVYLKVQTVSLVVIHFLYNKGPIFSLKAFFFPS